MAHEIVFINNTLNWWKNSVTKAPYFASFSMMVNVFSSLTNTTPWSSVTTNKDDAPQESDATISKDGMFLKTNSLSQGWK